MFVQVAKESKVQRRPIVASFVHGYLDMEARVSGTAPAMAVIGNDGEV